MRFRILGPLEVCNSHGETISLRAPKQRMLLIVLLLHANAPVSVGRIETALWHDRPPRSAAGVVRTYVCGLRSALGLGDAGQLPRLAKEPGGYRLLLPPDDLDLSVFDDLSARGRYALDRGDPAQAARLLSDALALWRGEPGEGVALDGDSAAILAGLAERRVMAEEAWTDAQLLLGSGANLIGRLRTLVAEHPLQERACGQLMLALYRSGRKAEALEEFRALRRRMTDELGVEPSTLTQDLHQRILADNPTLTLAHDPTVIPRQLPGDIRDFTGRDAALLAMNGLLPGKDTAAPAIIAITGMAGEGKTALAVHFAHLVADRFPDGQLFVDLGGHADAEPKPPPEALRGFLHALGVREIPSDADEAAALYRSLLARKRMIVLLDNAANAWQVRPLLPGSPGCLVLITSRSRLPGLLARNSAAPLIAGPLTGSEGAALLQKILGAARVATDPDAVAAIVDHCARLPLALRIAAERAASRPQLALATLATELAAEQRRLDALTIGEDADTSVRWVFSWSYHKLAPDAARMFRLLGLHPGPDIGDPAAAALAGSTLSDAARQLGVLADAHLLRETTADRYQFHDLLRTYAAELAFADDPPAARTAALQRVLTWYLHTADAAATMLVPTRSHVPLDPTSAEPLEFAGYDEALAWCDAEYANLVAAVDIAAEMGEDAIAWKLPVALASYLQICRPWVDWITAGQTAVRAARRAGDLRGESWLLNQLCHPYMGLGRFDDALDCLHRALRIRTEIGDRQAEGCTLNNIGAAYGEQGQFEDAIRYFRSALGLAVEIGDQRSESVALLNLGEAHQGLAQHDKATFYLHQALRIARENDDARVEGSVLSNLSEIFRALGWPAVTRDHLQQALAAWQRAGDRKNEAETHCALGDLLSGIGEARAAREHWSAAQAVFEKLGDPRARELRRRLEALPPRVAYSRRNRQMIADLPSCEPDDLRSRQGALMKIGLAAVGTRGDVEPFVALTHALMQAGHEVAFAAPADAARLAEGADAQFVPMDLDLRAAFESEQGRRWLAAEDVGAFQAGVGQMLSAARSSIGESVLAVADRCDVLVTSCLSEDYGYAVAQARKIPIVPAHLFPLLPTSEYPHPLTPQDVPDDGQATAARNLETYRNTEKLFWQGARDDINGFRRSLGLDQAPCPLLSRMPELELTVLQAFSGEIVRRPADWGPHSVMTGFWRLPVQVRHRIGEAEPRDLADWLADGPPPVFIGFGSMPVLEPEKVIDMVAEAARLTGLRIVIGAGWSDLSGLAASLPDNVWLTGAVDHDWLFPQCTAVIHHGGAGTTAAGLIAGRATWIFTVFGDQPFWGHRVAGLGAGGHDRFADFDLDHLTSALRELVREDIQQRARALGKRLRAENGLADAVRTIEKVAG